MIDSIERAVWRDLQGGQVVALVQNPRDDINRGETAVRTDLPERVEYWERSFIVVWKREVRNGQPSLDNDGHVYATHRVHVNSLGESACYNGNYDQSYLGALNDMLERAQVNLVPDIDRATELAMDIDGVKHVHLRRSGVGTIVGIVSDDVTGQEYDVRQTAFDSWYASDDDGNKHSGRTVRDAVLAAREANS